MGLPQVSVGQLWRRRLSSMSRHIRIGRAHDPPCAPAGLPAGAMERWWVHWRIHWRLEVTLNIERWSRIMEGSELYADATAPFTSRHLNN